MISGHRQNWSTAEAAPGRAVAYWRQAVCEAVFELDVKADDEAPFTASLQQERAGPIGLSRIHISASQCITRRKRDIARSRAEQFELVYFRHCNAVLNHVGQEVALGSEQCVLIDSRKEYVLALQGESENLSVHIPTRWLAARIPEPEMYLGRPIIGDTPWGRSLIALLSAMHADSSGSEERDHLFAEQIAGALYLAISPPEERPSHYANPFIHRIRQALCDLSHDPGLNAALLASEMGISLRYLHALFAQAGTTYGQELQAIRLRSAARMLRDARFRDLSVNEIALRAGYSEPSHFSRRFREAFDMTPAVFRAKILG
ncbi:MAG: helix-turn-helix domain-containing protein [Bradyrhizobiaceae bacterium]|nr:helix-turn-helix domain-containing protein [Bradyrhizobiaceae bacterium]